MASVTYGELFKQALEEQIAAGGDVGRMVTLVNAYQGTDSVTRHFAFRDWLDASGWDHSPPGPELPADVVGNTRTKYVEAYERVVGQPFERWTGGAQ